MRGDIFILCHVSARFARVQRSCYKSLRVKLYPNKRKTIPPPERWYIFRYKKSTHARNLLETFMKAVYTKCIFVPQEKAKMVFQIYT